MVISELPLIYGRSLLILRSFILLLCHYYHCYCYDAARFWDWCEMRGMTEMRSASAAHLRRRYYHGHSASSLALTAPVGPHPMKTFKSNDDVYRRQVLIWLRFPAFLLWLPPPATVTPSFSASVKFLGLHSALYICDAEPSGVGLDPTRSLPGYGVDIRIVSLLSCVLVFLSFFPSFLPSLLVLFGSHLLLIRLPVLLTFIAFLLFRSHSSLANTLNNYSNLNNNNVTIRILLPFFNENVFTCFVVCYIIYLFI